MTECLNLKQIKASQNNSGASASQADDWETYAQKSSKSSRNSGQSTWSKQRYARVSTLMVGTQQVVVNQILRAKAIHGIADLV